MKKIIPSNPGTSPPDCVVQLRENQFEAFVDGKLYGAWRSSAEATAGMQVERRRIDARRVKSTA